MADWIEERISSLINAENRLVKFEEVLDDTEIRLLQLSRRLNLEQRCDMLRTMYSIVGSDESLKI